TQPERKPVRRASQGSAPGSAWLNIESGRRDVTKGHSVRSYGSMAAALVAATLVLGIGHAMADGSGDPKAVKNEVGKDSDKGGTRSYNVGSDGKVDWYPYSGFRRYHSDCHVCHGPDGEGSTYAPALKDSLKSISYSDFVGVVASGRKNVNSSSENVMPAF